MSSLVLDSTFMFERRGPGFARLRLVNAGHEPFAGFRLGFTSVIRLTPTSGCAAALVEQAGSYHELAAPDDFVLSPGQVWDLGLLRCDMHMVHANDGPARGFVVRSDGSTVPVHVAVTEQGGHLRVGDQAPPRVVLAVADDVAGAAWATAAACERRLHPDDDLVLTSEGAGADVNAGIDEWLGPDAFQLAGDAATGFTASAGSRRSLQWAFMELARRQRGDGALPGSSFVPRFGFRGLMVDLSRHFVPAVDVAEIIDVAAWRRLDVVHLHLTDDQAWRVPSATYPALGAIGAWRGYGRPIPPLHGSGADPYGGCYTMDDISGWVARAAELGIELIPEIDVPGHSFATLAALPELRDPDDAGTALSVHSFHRNVLNPGIPGTLPFLEAVFGELADLFPGSRLHIGGDEVPDDSWAGSPAAQRWAAERGLDGHAAIERAFVAEIVRVVRAAAGRPIGAWQEAADLGGLQPDDGYVVGWRDAASAQRLADAGYDVVIAPAEAYYLDMASGPGWQEPGHWWAGTVTSEVISSFDPTAGWSAAASDRVIGIEACLWGEFVPDRHTMHTLLFPRLDAFADAGWTPVRA